MQLTATKLQEMIAEQIQNREKASKAEWEGLLKEAKAQADRIANLEKQLAEAHFREHAPTAYQKAASGFIASDKHKGAGLFAARVVRALMAMEGGLVKDARDLALKGWNDKATADAVDKAIQLNSDKSVLKALASQVAADGAVLIADEQSSELIPMLRAQSVMLGMGPTVMSMNGLRMKIPRQTSAVTAAFEGENEETNASQAALDQIALVLKKLVAITAASNDFLLFAGPQGDAMIRDDITKQIGLRLDLAMIRDVGSDFGIQGVRYATLPANVDAALSYTLANITSTLFAMLEDVAGANAPLQGGGWVFCSRIMHALMAIRDGNGNYAFKDEMVRGTLLGYPFAISNQIPQNLGGGTETEIYFVVFPEWIYGEGVTLGIKKMDGAAYRDSSGTMIAGFSADQTAYRVSMYADWKAKHNVSAAVRTGCTWAA